MKSQSRTTSWQVTLVAIRLKCPSNSRCFRTSRIPSFQRMAMITRLCLLVLRSPSSIMAATLARCSSRTNYVAAHQNKKIGFILTFRYLALAARIQVALLSVRFSADKLPAHFLISLHRTPLRSGTSTLLRRRRRRPNVRSLSSTCAQCSKTSRKWLSSSWSESYLTVAGTVTKPTTA